jgi:hypothetical protein
MSREKHGKAEKDGALSGEGNGRYGEGENSWKFFADFLPADERHRHGRRVNAGDSVFEWR